MQFHGSDPDEHTPGLFSLPLMHGCGGLYVRRKRDL